jgi:hypothetical protein
VTGVSVSDANNVTLTIAQVAAFETSKVGLSIQSGQQVVLADTAANIAALTTTQIAGLNALHVTQIQAADTTVKLTAAEATALESAAIPVAAPSGSLVEISETAAHLQALTVAQINGLVANDAAIKFTVAQTIALEAAHLTVAPFSGTTITASDAGANIATLSAVQIGLLGHNWVQRPDVDQRRRDAEPGAGSGAGVTALSASDTAVVLNVAQAPITSINTTSSHSRSRHPTPMARTTSPTITSRVSSTRPTRTSTAAAQESPRYAAT